ncbi:MAG: hypothetical protein FWC13_06725 [Oscillospiraceae bacterium]|nr:hypothetical protein [Oscillospiraceae bacterium]
MIPKLNSIISHAYKEVEYYHRLFDEKGINTEKINTMQAFEQIPFLSRDELQSDESRFIADCCQYFPWNEKLELRRTISSSGHFMKIYWSGGDNGKSTDYFNMFRKDLRNVSPLSKICSFYGTFYIGNKLSEHKDTFLSHDGAHILFSHRGLSSSKISDYLKRMDDFGVNGLYLQPSVAVLLAETIKSENLTVPNTLVYIELTGEFLSDDHRKLIQEVFQVELAYSYNLEEFNTIAYECGHDSLHILENNVVVEVIKDGKSVFDEIGEICITSLTNHAMPLLRVLTGDTGILTEAKCECGATTNTLKLISTHLCNFITTEDGQKISVCVLSSIVEHTNESMQFAIRKFCITQKSSNLIDVEISLKPAFEGWHNSVKREFLKSVKEFRLPEVGWSFTFY